MSKRVEVIAHIQKSLNGNMSLVFGPGGHIELVRKAEYDALAAQRDEGLAREAELRKYFTEVHTALQDIQRICNAMGYLSEIHKVADKALAMTGCTNKQKSE